MAYIERQGCFEDDEQWETGDMERKTDRKKF